MVWPCSNGIGYINEDNAICMPSQFNVEVDDCSQIYSVMLPDSQANSACCLQWDRKYYWPRGNDITLTGKIIIGLALHRPYLTD